MGNGGEPHLWNMAGGCINPFAIPDRLARFGKKIGEKTAALPSYEAERVSRRGHPEGRPIRLPHSALTIRLAHAQSHPGPQPARHDIADFKENRDPRSETGDIYRSEQCLLVAHFGRSE